MTQLRHYHRKFWKNFVADFCYNFVAVGVFDGQIGPEIFGNFRNCWLGGQAEAAGRKAGHRSFHGDYYHDV